MLTALLTRLPFAINQARSTPKSSSRGATQSRRSNTRRTASALRLFPIDLQVRPGIAGSLTVVLSYTTLGGH